MLRLQFAVHVLVHGDGIDDAHGVAVPQPLEFRDHLTVKVGVVESENDKLHWPDCHVFFLRSGLTVFTAASAGGMECDIARRG